MSELVPSVRNVVPYIVRHCIMGRSVVLSPETFHMWHKSTDGADSDQMCMSGVMERPRHP